MSIDDEILAKLDEIDGTLDEMHAMMRGEFESIFATLDRIDAMAVRVNEMSTLRTKPHQTSE
ncbi:hypothetical protein AWB81_08151 [Caballeronia arationis]|uniref:hypothetical protein n=1 Tax=Caballeronia arationis TaxID=1777142 RepID=UPI00074BBE57|nr:hypothetical protein [Caballeronia arationis]SAL07544.1 hypothetical protein AWB81_08151 [Caballeronia arationis]